MVKYLLIAFFIILLILTIINGFRVFKEIPYTVWVCFLVAAGYMKKQGGTERRPFPCELRFYDDYLVQVCLVKYYRKSYVRQEYFKFKYSDIIDCLYRTVCQQISFSGIVEATFYKYNKNGVINEKPCHHIIADSLSYFYTVFEPNINFVKEIEEHSPIKVRFEES